MTAMAAALNNRRWADPVIVVVGLFLAWQLCHELAGDIAVTAPWPTFLHLADMFKSGRIWPHLFESLYAFGIALMISIGGGIGIGVLIGSRRLALDVSEPILIALYSLPKITLYPVILLCFGLGLSAKIAFGALHGIIPVILFTLAAIKGINPIYFRLSRTMRLSNADTIRHVIVPAALPGVFSGVRIGYSLTLLGTMISEMFAAQRGLGYMIITAVELAQARTILAVILLVSIFAIGSNLILLAIEQRLNRGAAAAR
jgi:NitT/TauT family transport system permease protein